MFILKKKKIGNMARNQLKEFENLIYNIKRLIGINFTLFESQNLKHLFLILFDMYLL